ncbi:MAG: hypothetical protein AAGA15_17175 [Pseudomonadota bacterium]
MGIHVLVINRKFIEHPEWDWVRCAGDSYIPFAVKFSGQVLADFGYGEDRPVRPADVGDLFKEMMRYAPENVERWNCLCDILRDNRWWLSFSY